MPETLNSWVEKRKERQRHINATQIILIKILWRTFFRGGPFGMVGLVRILSGYVFWDKQKNWDCTVVLRILKRDRGQWISLITFIQNFFSLKDLNARHFIWPELCIFWESFYNIRNTYRTCFFFFVSKDSTSEFQAEKGIPNISNPKWVERCTGKGLRSQKNISFKDQHVKNIHFDRSVQCKSDRQTKPLFLFLNGEGGEVETHNGLCNPQTTLHYFLFSLIPSAFLLLLINPLGESTWSRLSRMRQTSSSSPQISDGFTSFCVNLILWQHKLLSNEFTKNHV